MLSFDEQLLMVVMLALFIMIVFGAVIIACVLAPIIYWCGVTLEKYFH